MSIKTARIGALLLNPPVMPNALLSPADFGGYCQCDGATGDFVEFEVAIPLATSPDLTLVDSFSYNDSNGVTKTQQLSKQYFINTATADSVFAEIVAEIKNTFKQWVLEGGGLTYSVGGGTFTIGGEFQAPFVPISVTVDSVAVNFS